MMKFNINHYVKVKLTEKGIEILKEQHNDIQKYALLLPDFEEPQKDDDGYTKFQLWELMLKFGNHLYNGCEVPFHPEIIIED